MSRAALVEQAQRFAERGMVDTCLIRRQATTTEDADGNVVPVHSTLYAGMCRVQQQQPYAERNDAGQAYRLLLRIEVQLPVSVTGLEPEDVVTIETAARDGDLPGRVFVVRDLAHKTDPSSRRIQCQEVTS